MPNKPLNPKNAKDIKLARKKAIGYPCNARGMGAVRIRSRKPAKRIMASV